ncbi:MAG: alkaline phosphatase family protein [Longimicrobiales bacterium]
MRVLLLFLDGVGLGDDADYNPFVQADLPNLRRLLDGTVPLRAVAPLHTAAATLLALDATLDVEGTPQSGTGQATLLTGRNAAQMHGAHFGPWVPVRLRPMLREDSVLAQAIAVGHTVTFANAYPEELIRLAEVPAARVPQFLRAGPPVAAIGAGVFTRNASDLKRGNAVASEIVNDGWRDRLGVTGLPDLSPAEAGENLARISAGYDLTLFAHYQTDTEGHRKDTSAAVAALERVDTFLGGVVATMSADTLLFVTSDHGNIEDTRTGHTRNPAIALAVGRDHEILTAGVESLLDVTPMIMRILSGTVVGPF